MLCLIYKKYEGCCRRGEQYWRLYILHIQYEIHILGNTYKYVRYIQMYNNALLIFFVST